MTQSEIIEAIKALTEVVKANSGWLGSEATMKDANAKIKELIPLLNRNKA